MKNVKGNIAARAAEPSTHAGIAAVAQAAGMIWPQYAAFANAAAVLFGALAVAMPERG